MIIKKSILIICLFFLNLGSLWSQGHYFATASNGLILRKEPTTSSERIGKLPYGTITKIIEETEVVYQVNEGNVTTNSVWVKVTYDNFPYIDANDNGYQWDKTGYVVKHYLEKLNKGYITTQKIDSLTFHCLYKEPIPYTPIKFTDFLDVKKTLSHRVQWGNNDFLEDGTVLDKIVLPNGQTLKVNIDANEFTFIAYYPSEEILLFEGGHSSDFSFSIKTGETLATVGNPEYIKHSSSGKYRLNGWFPGQECSSYFIQEKVGDHYTYLTSFDYGTDKLLKEICYFKKFAWISDTKFIYSFPNYSPKKYKTQYFMGQINKE